MKEEKKTSGNEDKVQVDIPKPNNEHNNVALKK